MQQTGTLKKRRRRNLSKVNGLSTVEYDETLDSFTGQNLFAEDTEDAQPFVILAGQDTRLRLSSQSMLESRRATSNGSNQSDRITRNPDFFNPNAPFEHEFNDFIPPDDNEKPENGPTHFLPSYAMRRLKIILFLGKTSGAFPWTWNDKTYQIDRWNPATEKMWWIYWALFTIQTGGITLFQVFEFYLTLKESHTSYKGTFMNSLSLFWYLWAVAFNTNLYFHKENIRKYINTMLNFNHDYVKKYLIHLDDYQYGGRISVRYVSLTNIGQVLVTVNLFWSMPNLPWFLFSYIYPKPWYWQIPGLIQEYMKAGQVITSYVLIYWIVVAHANTLQFWLKEIHNNNDSDYTSDQLRHPKTSVETYKALQILNQCFNECMAPMSLPLLKFHIFPAWVICGYVVVRSLKDLSLSELTSISTFCIGIWNLLPAAFSTLSLAAGVYDLGCSFIDSWSRTRHKDFRRILMSCPTMKIWTGRFYFITISTTLTFLKFLFDAIIDCVITIP